MAFHHITNPHPHKPSADLSQFYVVTPVSNPVRYKRRYELYWRFKEMCEAADVKLITVEQAFGLRPFMLTEPANPMHVQVRTVEELWHKENMINLGIQRAAEHGAREIAWIDADIRPANPPREWFEETWHELQHYEFVQMFESLMDLDQKGNALNRPTGGFMANYLRLGSPDAAELHEMALAGDPALYPYADSATTKELFLGHPGGAWAAGVDAISKVGGLVDYAILGSADHYMAYALLGTLQASTLGVTYSGAYAKRLMAWQDRAEHRIKRDVGYVPGLIMHDFHGSKAQRGYGSRWRILVDNEYDPDTDIKYDAQGLLQLETVTPRQIRLRDQTRAYFRSRNEDQAP